MSPPVQSSAPRELSIARQRFLTILLAAMVGGHLLCLVSGIDELWPFSSYSLYTESRDPLRAEQYVLVGVEGQSSSEVDLFLNEAYIRPHYRASHHGSFRRLAEGPDSARLLTAAAADCLKLYEQRRVRGRHDGPALVAARIYLYTWRYDAANATTRLPTDRRLLAEARMPGPGSAP